MREKNNPTHPESTLRGLGTAMQPTQTGPVGAVLNKSLQKVMVFVYFHPGPGVSRGPGKAELRSVDLPSAPGPLRLRDLPQSKAKQTKNLKELMKH
jgi:hypothetical protein